MGLVDVCAIVDAVDKDWGIGGFFLTQLFCEEFFVGFFW